MMFASSIWFPSEDKGNIGRARTMYTKLRNIQKNVIVTIFKGFNRTADEALNVELNLLPTKQMLGLTATKFALRILSNVTFTIQCFSVISLVN